MGDGEATDFGYTKFIDCHNDGKSTRQSPSVCLSSSVITYNNV